MTSNVLIGKVALVTGASSGMGRAVCLMLQKEGAKLVCCDLQAKANPQGYEEDLDTTTVDLIIERGGEALFQKVDIADLDQVDAAFAVGLSVSTEPTQKVRLRLIDRAAFWPARHISQLCWFLGTFQTLFRGR